ncbi:MAG TPA: hypothetical protein PKN14_05235 [Bacteroidia bacterium]|nr:hypothetical protein [Bacteroidia bacterium]HNR48633.1 hypothetical protein [Bacteroidia bacterium]HNT81796.1 hypothetical protein [Bacteroidia bacterium]
MILERNEIEKIIPQRAPFVMIDTLKQADETGFQSEFTARADNIFMKDNRLTEPALIENIAQTCAAGFGYLGSQTEGQPRIGYIGAISRLTVHNLPVLGSTITTHVTVLHQMGSIFLVKGENESEGKKLISCEMKIALA